MMNWFFYSLLAAVSMSVYSVLCRALLRDRGDGLAFTLITTFFGGLALLGPLPLEKIVFPQNFTLVLILVPLALFFGLIDFIFIRGRQLEEVANVSVAIQSNHFWNVLGSVLILGELLTAPKLLGIILIVLANLAILWEGQKVNVSPGIKIILLGTFLWTIAAYADKILSPGFSALVYKAALFFLEALWLFLLLGHRRFQRVQLEWRLQGWRLILVGPLLAFFNLFYVRAFQAGGQASQVLPILSLSLVLATMGGVIFLGERKNLGRKILASVIAFAGAFLVQSV